MCIPFQFIADISSENNISSVCNTLAQSEFKGEVVSDAVKHSTQALRKAKVLSSLDNRVCISPLSTNVYFFCLIRAKEFHSYFVLILYTSNSSLYYSCEPLIRRGMDWKRPYQASPSTIYALMCIEKVGALLIKLFQVRAYGICAIYL